MFDYILVLLILTHCTIEDIEEKEEENRNIYSTTKILFIFYIIRYVHRTTCWKFYICIQNHCMK